MARHGTCAESPRRGRATTLSDRDQPDRQQRDADETREIAQSHPETRCPPGESQPSTSADERRERMNITPDHRSAEAQQGGRRFHGEPRTSFLPSHGEVDLALGDDAILLQEFREHARAALATTS